MKLLIWGEGVIYTDDVYPLVNVCVFFFLAELGFVAACTLSLLAVRRLLIAVASLVAEHRL